MSELKKALKSKPESIEIDSSELSRITTPCVQIILAAKKSCSDQGIEFFIGNQSPNFVECIETLGVNLN